jgi:hypothetical protein
MAEELYSPTKLTTQERIKIFSKKYYSDKIHNDAEFYAKEKQRNKEYKYNRYKNDPEYAEKEKIRANKYYHNRKLKLQEEAKLKSENTAEIIIQ